MPTIGGMWISWWVSAGPSGPGWGGCMSVDVYINIVYIVPTIGGWYVGNSLPQYCINRVNNWGNVDKLVGTGNGFLIHFVNCSNRSLHLCICILYYIAVAHDQVYIIVSS